jgi:hypothetical protein
LQQQGDRIDPKRPFEGREKDVPDPRARPAQVRIGRIIVVCDAVVGQPCEDFLPPQIQQRTHDLTSTNWNPAQTPDSGSSLDPKQNGFRLVVGLVSRGDARRAEAGGLGLEELVPGRSKRCVLKRQPSGGASDMTRNSDQLAALHAAYRGLT